MTPRDEATQRQIEAAMPGNSTWLSANAGSGKTRVLTDRVARLLLDGTDPQHVLCLTYTKAAASEMQNRLFARLGDWAMASNDKLAAELEGLGVDGPLGPELLAEGRRLFARAIETPGGLKIQTIHSFCAGLLRRFPLEAGVSPQFAEIEDRAAELLRAEIVDQLARRDPDAVDALAEHYRSDDLAKLVGAIAGRKAAFRAGLDEARLAAALGARMGATEETLLTEALPADLDALLADLATACRTGGKTDNSAAEKLARLTGTRRIEGALFDSLTQIFLTGAGARSPFSAKLGSFPTKAVQAAHPDLMARIEPLMESVEALRQPILAQRALEKTRALYRFGTPFIRAYEAAKAARGLLDFDDLIDRTAALLEDPVVSQWVLWRLDGGIDHILVDEAQDTNPAQWQVIRSLAREFGAGEGARPDRRRTIFVVGDKKQSIYSFQGADPEEFDRMQAHFAQELGQVGDALNPLTLEHSFRSSAAILTLVDRTFVGSLRDGLEQEVFHRAFKSDLPGRVDLWPAIPKQPEDEDDRRWFEPVDRVGKRHHNVLLAEAIAERIQSLIQHETLPEEIDRSGKFRRRPITEGDILILVRSRSPLFAEIIRACKARGLKVAGADRLKLGGELAVKDLAALLQFLALPEDDLSLAGALRSPLFGWSEQEIYTLAQGRGDVFLWQALRAAQAVHPDDFAMLEDLLDQSDFLRPYDLIERILTRHDGRRRLLARLGAEAEDGIDALLAQALAYERSAVPSLTGFLSWMETDDVEVKRQLDAAGDRLRVMTVHGAKGLEAPIVILPDTGKRRREVKDPIWSLDDQALWPPQAAAMPDSVLAEKERRLAAQDREGRRQLYVALTRAESWLMICGAGKMGDEPEESWYRMVEAGLVRCGAEAAGMPTGEGLRLSHLDWDALPFEADTSGQTDRVEPPRLDPVSAQERQGAPLSPSNLGGAKALPGDPGEGDVDAAMARGTQIHLLLEHLPGIPMEDRPQTARRILEGVPDVADPEELIDLTLRLLGTPRLAPVFAAETLAEVEITAGIDEGGPRIHGSIDRLIVESDRVLAVDFKSNRLVPDRPEEIPEGLLRQLGAYRAALVQLYPDRSVEVAILWTETAELMVVPGPLVTAALARATAP